MVTGKIEMRLMEADADLYSHASLMWRQHIGICTALVLLAIPLYVADRNLLKGGGGDWISLKLNGLIIIPYIAFVAVQIAVSSLALFQFPTARVIPLHLICGVISTGLLVVGRPVAPRRAGSALSSLGDSDLARSGVEALDHERSIAQPTG